MKFRKGLVIICLIICLFSIAGVCASDVNDTAIDSDIDNEVIVIETTDQMIVEVNDDGNACSQEEDVLSASELSDTYMNEADESNDSILASNDEKTISMDENNSVLDAQENNYIISSQNTEPILATFYDQYEGGWPNSFEITSPLENGVYKVGNYLNAYLKPIKFINRYASNGVPRDNTDVYVSLIYYCNDTKFGSHYCRYTKSDLGKILKMDFFGFSSKLSKIGEYTVKIALFSDDNIVGEYNFTVEKGDTELSASEVTATYGDSKDIVVTLEDGSGNILKSKKVTINVGTISETLTTNNKGQVSVDISGLIPKTYTATISFAGDDKYVNSSTTVNVIVKKVTPKLTAKAKTFKKSVQTKYTVTLKNNLNKVMKNTKVTIKVNKKTYTAKTNSKGKATFKIAKLTKKGKYNAVVTYKGDNYYNKVTKKVKITVK